MIKPPLSFLLEYSVLNWNDIVWAYRRKLIDWTVVVDFASKSMEDDIVTSNILEIAWISKEDAHRIGALLDEFPIVPKYEEAAIRKKWLYLILAWIFECRDKISHPLKVVEAVYADFDYPEEIQSFIGYMPPTDGYQPNNHTLEENEVRLLNEWESFLRINKKKFSI